MLSGEKRETILLCSGSMRCFGQGSIKVAGVGWVLHSDPRRAEQNKSVPISLKVEEAIEEEPEENSVQFTTTTRFEIQTGDINTLTPIERLCKTLDNRKKAQNFHK